MKFKTSLTKIKDGKESIRGYALSDLAQKKSFVETIFLLLKGVLPTEQETRMMNALLTTAIDHGPGTASTLTARVSASAKNNIHTSVAAGILAMGERHGMAIEGAAVILQNEADLQAKGKDFNISALVKGFKEAKVRVPGYGHAILSHDERASALFDVAKETGFYGRYSMFAEAFGEELNRQSSKPVPLNVDGAMAAVLLDMGFSWNLMGGIFIIARVPGLVAHICEEIAQDNGIRRLSESEEIVYEP